MVNRLRKELKASFMFMAILMALPIFGLGIVHASPDVFNSHPQDHAILGGISVTSPAAAYDVDNFTYADFNYKQGPPGGFEVNTFTTHPVNFSITGVDFKMKFDAADGGTKANYQISYYVDPSLTQTILQAWTGAVHPAAVDVWAGQPEPNDGTWTWDDIANIRFVVETKKVSGGGSVDFFEYEAWVTVHLGPAPTAKLTVEPATIDEQSPGSSFYIDIYATDVVHMWGYELNMSYDTSVLTATSFSSFFPFTTPWPSGIEDADGNIYIAYSMPFGEPDGVTGRAQLCRINFNVDAAGGSLLDIYHSVLSDILGDPIPHDVYDGVYSTPVPEFPLGMAIELGLIVTVVFVWWRRKGKTKLSKVTNGNTLSR